MVLPESFCLSQNIIHSVRIPRIEATQPKTTVPISLGPQREPCWKPREIMVDDEAFDVVDDSRVRVSLSGDMLFMTRSFGCLVEECL